jgi:formate dehydrogenase maturation protein FdhE
MCPVCGSARVVSIDDTNRIARVDYFRCQACSSVWTLPKGRPDDTPEIITVRRNVESV